MGNQCQNCFDNSQNEKPQLICSNYLTSSKGYVDVEISECDQFLYSYIKERNWAKERKKLKKNMQTNKFYYGDWQNNLPEGKGVLYQPNKILIDSNFVAGSPNGQSMIIFIEKNSQYVGQLLNGKINGKGIMNDFSQQYSFSGLWNNSIPVSGVLNLGKDSNIQKIQFIYFKARMGKIYYLDGRLYQGDIDNQRLIPQGRGKVQFPKFDVKDYYDGQWKDGMYDGNGAFHWKNGEYYIGGYKIGQKDGFGKFKFYSGGEYQGNWSRGKQQGIGTLFDRNGFILKQGVWKNGNFVGPDRFHNYGSQYNKNKFDFDSGEIQQIPEDIVNENFDQIIRFHALGPDFAQPKQNIKYKQLTMANLKIHSSKD